MLELISLTCAVLGTALALPQCIQIVRSKTAAGVSLLGWQLMLVSSVGWFVHGILANGMAFLVPNGTTALFGLFIIAMIVRERHLNLVKVAYWPAALTAVAVGLRIFGLGAIAPEVAFSLFILIPQIISVAGMGLDLIRSMDISGVSGNYLVSMAGLQGLWLLYGFLASDSAAQISSGVMVGLATLNTLIFYARAWGVIDAKPGFMKFGSDEDAQSESAKDENDEWREFTDARGFKSRMSTTQTNLEPIGAWEPAGYSAKGSAQAGSTANRRQSEQIWPDGLEANSPWQLQSSDHRHMDSPMDSRMETNMDASRMNRSQNFDHMNAGRRFEDSRYRQANHFDSHHGMSDPYPHDEFDHRFGIPGQERRYAQTNNQNNSWTDNRRPDSFAPQHAQPMDSPQRMTSPNMPSQGGFGGSQFGDPNHFGPHTGGHPAVEQAGMGQSAMAQNTGGHPTVGQFGNRRFDSQSIGQRGMTDGNMPVERFDGRGLPENRMPESRGQRFQPSQPVMPMGQPGQMNQPGPMNQPGQSRQFGQPPQMGQPGQPGQFDSHQHQRPVDPRGNVGSPAGGRREAGFNPRRSPQSPVDNTQNGMPVPPPITIPSPVTSSMPSLTSDNDFDRWLAVTLGYGQQSGAAQNAEKPQQGETICPMCDGAGYLFEGGKLPRRMRG